MYVHPALLEEIRRTERYQERQEVPVRKQSFQFTDPVALAKFVAQIVREGLTYEVVNLCGGGWSVTLTGGF